MKYNPKIHHRQSIRLQEYDYHQTGTYFVTACTQNHEYLFGNIVAGEIQSNNVGLTIRRWYAELPHKFPDSECDAFIRNPTHIPFITVTVGGAMV